MGARSRSSWAPCLAFAQIGNDAPSEAELRKQVGIDPLDYDARIKLASALAGNGRFRDAMEKLLEVVRLGKRDQADDARAQLLSLFMLSAVQPVLVTEFRRKLASALG